MANNSGEKLAAAIDGMYRDVDRAESSSYIDDLIKTVDLPNPKIPENVFKELFYPYLIGDKESSDDNQVLAHWCGVVGSASQEVDIVNVKGDVLFTVPPVYDTSVIATTDKLPLPSFGAIFTELGEQAMIHPDIARGYFKEAIVPKFQSKVGETDMSAWIPALTFYGLMKPDDNKAPTGEKQAIIPEDEMKFD